MPAPVGSPAIAPPYRKFVVGESGGIIVGEIVDPDDLFVASHRDLAASLADELATAGWILIRDDNLVGIVQDGEADGSLPLGRLALEQWAAERGATIRVLSSSGGATQAATTDDERWRPELGELASRRPWVVTTSGEILMGSKGSFHHNIADAHGLDPSTFIAIGDEDRGAITQYGRKADWIERVRQTLEDQ